MAASHFLKHLACSRCSRNLLHPFHSPHARFFPFSFAATQAREKWTSSSSFTRKIAFHTSPSPSSSSLSLSVNGDNSLASQYLSVRIWCRKEFVDVLSESLLCFGASSTSVDEEDACDSSDKICVDTIFPEGHDVRICISHAADSVGLKEIPHYEVKIGDQYDWIKKTQESFRPIEVTEGLWIVPEWRTPPDVQAMNIIINPGLAFGTGDHPTTKLCLLLLHGLVKGGELIFDYGTGSGILAIAALKFGAALSVGIDIDPQAIGSAQQNASLNNIEPSKMKLHLVSENESKHGIEAGDSDQTEVISGTGKFDVVIANILLNPLLGLADHIVSYAKPEAVIGLSGILSEQVPFIIEKYSQYLEDISVSEIDGWACVSGVKRRNPTGSVGS